MDGEGIREDMGCDFEGELGEVHRPSRCRCRRRRRRCRGGAQSGEVGP